jgi:general stress protein 26
MDPVEVELDERFSDPGASATPWEEAKRALEEADLFWISTVRRDGRPHVTPLVAVWRDGALHFCTGPDEQKAVNLEANSRVALTTGCNRWQDGLDIVVEGEAERVTEPTALRDLADAWERKWDGSWRFEVRDGAFRHADGGVAHVFAVRPRKALAFGKGGFSHTRYLF